MKVHIIGKGQGWQLAPKNGETWGVNDLVLRRDVKKVFDMHNLIPRFGEELKWATVEKVNALKIPFFSVRKYSEIPTSISYPLDEVIDALGTDYFTNSIDYMIAYAVYTKVDEINLYGVNMVVGSEWAFEKPGVDFWVGYAKGRGIEVNVFGRHSEIMQSRNKKLYGYNRNQSSVTQLIEKLEKLDREEQQLPKLFQKVKTLMEWM